MQGVVIVAALTVALLENLLFCWRLCKKQKANSKGQFCFVKWLIFVIFSIWLRK